MSIARIRKNDTVVAITGAYAGQTGRVLEMDNAKGKAIVEGLNLVTKTFRRSQDNPNGDIRQISAPMQLSNLMPYDPGSKKGVRISRVREGDGFVRQGKKTGHRFE